MDCEVRNGKLTKQTKMDAKSLKLGNIIRYKDNDKVVPAFRGKTRIIDITVLRLIYEDKPDYYEPIPLTEEILLKAGFKEANYASYFQTKKWSNGENIITVTDDDCLVSMENTFNKRCEYLHELQNLYFALTGQELTIEL